MTDDRLAQLLSQSAIVHTSVLVQVDEFQETAQRWVKSNASVVNQTGVTSGGFCECLQGSTSMGRGVVVLTGTSDAAKDDIKCLLPAVFRRIHREAALGWMSKEDICRYFQHFLTRFVPNCTVATWAQWEQVFASEGSPWAGTRPISVDMLKQFLMHSITEASCLGLGNFHPSDHRGSGEFQVQVERQSDFFSLICDKVKAEAFLQSYAPVANTQ